MSIGLTALLDDVAALAKLAAASLDDIAAGAVKAGSKAVAVVVDDAAVTPQYVRGADPKRELPIIWKIAKGSLLNKAIILVLALALSQVASWALTPLLMLGGTYLCFEGAHKIWGALSGHHHEEPAVDRGQDAEKRVISNAVRTDFILSAEIMVIALNEVADRSLGLRTAILSVVALLITALVYGAVAIIVKLDDIGLHLAARPRTHKLGTFLVRAMPIILRTLTVVGVAAMLWVGGHLLVTGAAELGWHFPHDLIESLSSKASVGALAWLIETTCSLVFGFALGSLCVGFQATTSYFFHTSHAIRQS